MRYLILIVLLIPMVAAAERLLLAECRITEGDQYLEAGTRLIMVFTIESSTESIWIVKNGKIESYGSDSPETPFEVNGGVWSITLASDIRRSLRGLGFKFMEGNLPPAADQLSGDPEECVMDYTQIEHYESGEWARDDNDDSDR